MTKEKERFEILLEEIKANLKEIIENQKNIHAELRQIREELRGKMDEGLTDIELTETKLELKKLIDGLSWPLMN
jgi:hypothetical protein